VAGIPVLDIRTYTLVPGGGAEFDRIFREGARPMLERFGIRVVAYGPSLAEDDRYCLIRAFPSAAERVEQLESFYDSDEWRDRHETAVMALIDSYHTVVIPLVELPPVAGPSGSGE
jgi:hypothetical protein